MPKLTDQQRAALERLNQSVDLDAALARIDELEQRPNITEDERTALEFAAGELDTARAEVARLRQDVADLRAMLEEAAGNLGPINNAVVATLLARTAPK